MKNNVFKAWEIFGLIRRFYEKSLGDWENNWIFYNQWPTRIKTEAVMIRKGNSDIVCVNFESFEPLKKFFDIDRSENEFENLFVK